MKKTVLALLVVVSAAVAGAKVRVPSIFGNDMVLQCAARVTIWGEAAAGAAVSVATSWNGAEYGAVADAAGRWSVKVSTGKAGGPYTVTISDGEPLTLSGVMLGEVWICSGQSNMEMPISNWAKPVEESARAIADAKGRPDIRMFTMPKLSVDREAADNPSKWENAATADVSRFSAVAWFFGRTLHDRLDVPVGLINTSWGGSAIEAWMTTASIDAIPAIDHARAKSGNRDNSTPGLLYNGMIAPIRGFAARGFLWYQGESNRHNAADYAALQAAMVDLWREGWDNPRMPFYFVQLAPHRYDGDRGFSLPLTVEAQVRAMEITPRSGMAATTDIGDAPDIHPTRKRQVGERLAWMALADDYGVKGLPAPAPTFRSMKLGKGKITLSFNNVTAREPFAGPGTDMGGFEIAGDDGNFLPARADLVKDGTRIEVWSDKVPAPAAVRYAFHNYVPEATVATRAGQPLVPFRTDRWPVTENRR